MKLLKLLATILCFGIATSLWAANPPSNDTAAFAQIKALAGDWESKTPDGKTARLHYEVISGGSAVAEHFQSDELGPENAMLTVYYLDSGHLQLTHYCMARNQPHMQAESFDSGTGELRFAFVNATGLSGAEAGHMHNASIHFIDADHFSANWQFYEGGKPKFNEAVQYSRVR